MYFIAFTYPSFYHFTFDLSYILNIFNIYIVKTLYAQQYQLVLWCDQNSIPADGWIAETCCKTIFQFVVLWRINIVMLL
jgi:hypothetical protein